MEIKKVSIIGLGALGILFGNHLSKTMPKEDLRIIADEARIEKYKNQGIYCNGEQCDFYFMTPQQVCEPADLLIFAVKYDGLKEAIKAVKNQVAEHTIILSALNGITSEEVISEVYGMDKMLYCVAQGMDAVKVGNQLSYSHMGMLCFGERKPNFISEKVKAVEDFFIKTDFPHQVETDIYKRLWGKFMLNVGVNQTVAIYEGDYGTVQRQGEARNKMIFAMQEVMLLSKKVGTNLTQEDLNYWLSVLDSLNPKGKPSMRQDMEAKRYSEVELFSGAVLKLAKHYCVSVPINKAFYDRITAIESQYKA